MWFSKKSSSFASRVDKFWSEFGKNLDAIKQNLEDKNFEAASKMTEEALNLCLVDPTFMIGLIDGKIDLVLTPEGLKHRLLWLKFIKSRMPKEYEAKLTCTLGKPRAPRNVATIQMYGVSVDANEVMVYANFNDKSVDMCLYNETLSKLKSEDENKAYTLSLILCDNVVGEMIMINMLGEFEIIDEPREKGVPLIDFADLIDEKFGKEASNEPLKNFMVYELEPRSNELRDDVFTGYTSLSELLNEYYDGASDTYNEAFELGINFCFLAISHGGDIQFGVDSKNKISDALKESEICEIIGEANGEMRSYIDLICFDKDELEKVTSKFSKELGTKIEICEFKR